MSESWGVVPCAGSCGMPRACCQPGTMTWTARVAAPSRQRASTRSCWPLLTATSSTATALLLRLPPMARSTRYTTCTLHMASLCAATSSAWVLQRAFKRLSWSGMAGRDGGCRRSLCGHTRASERVVWLHTRPCTQCMAAAEAHDALLCRPSSRRLRSMATSMLSTGPRPESASPSAVHACSCEMAKNVECIHVCDYVHAMPVGRVVPACIA